MYSDADIITRGSRGTVRYAVRSSGNRPAKPFIEKTQKQFPQKYYRSQGSFQLISDGKMLTSNKFRKLVAKIYEFKVNSIRILCFQDGNEWVLTNGFKGKRGSGKCPPNEIKKANRIMREHLKRKK